MVYTYAWLVSIAVFDSWLIPLSAVPKPGVSTKKMLHGSVTPDITGTFASMISSEVT